MKLKNEFIANMKSELTALNIQIEKLAEKVETAGNAARADAKSKLKSLRNQADNLNKQLDESNNIDESNWDGFKALAEKSYSEMKDVLKQSRQWLSEKIAP